MKYCGVFGLIMLTANLVCIGTEEPDINRIENSILEYYKYVGGYVWKWPDPEKVCKMLRTEALYVEVDRKTETVTLRTQGCAKIKMEILECIYATSASNMRNARLTYNQKETNVRYARGANGEVYKVVSPYADATTCNNGSNTLVINICVTGGRYFALDFTYEEKLLCKTADAQIARTWYLPDYKCEFLRPSDYTFMASSQSTENILLSSTTCKKLPLQVLSCFFTHINTDEIEMIQYARGYNWAIFKVTPRLEENDPNTYVLRERLVDHRNKRVQKICPNPYN